MDLGYFNARIRGMRGALFGAPEYEVFLKASGLEELMARLRDTPYGRGIEISEARFTGVDKVFSSAMRESLSGAFALLWRIAPPGAAPLLKAVLSIWEAEGLKSVIRGVEKGVKREEILKTVIAAGEFNVGALNMLSGSRDIKEIQRYLETWASPYAAPVREGLKAYEDRRSLVDIEIGIDKSAMRSLLAGVPDRGGNGRIIREMLEIRSDAANIMTLFKISGEGFSKEGAGDFFLDGGAALDKGAFLALSVLKDRDELSSGLLKIIKDKDLKRVILSADYEDTGMMEELFDEAVRKRLMKLSIVEPLSIAIAVSFIYMKVREIKNLRLIAASKSYGIPAVELKRHLMYL